MILFKLLRIRGKNVKLLNIFPLISYNSWIVLIKLELIPHILLDLTVKNVMAKWFLSTMLVSTVQFMNIKNNLVFLKYQDVFRMLGIFIFGWQMTNFKIFLSCQISGRPYFISYLPQHCLYFLPEPQVVEAPILSVLFILIVLFVFPCLSD